MPPIPPDPNTVVLEILLRLGAPYLVTFVVGSFMALVGWASVARSSVTIGLTLAEKIRLGAGVVPATVRFVVGYFLAVASALVAIYPASQFLAAMFGLAPDVDAPAIGRWRIEFWIPILDPTHWSPLTTVTLTAGVLSSALLLIARLSDAKWLFLLINGLWAIPIVVLALAAVLNLFPFVIVFVASLGPQNELTEWPVVLAWLSVSVALGAAPVAFALVRTVVDPDDSWSAN